MFSKEIQNNLRKNGFELESDDEENIWIKEINNDDQYQSVTISGDDDEIHAIWQTFDCDFDEISMPKIDDILDWSDKKLKGIL